MIGTAHSEFATDRLVIMSAPNGARRTSADHPALPITPAQLADAARSLLESGCSVLHLHVRDEQQNHTLDVDRYRAAMNAVSVAVGDGLIVQITTEAVGQYQPHEQMDAVRRLRPEAVSLALRELCPDASAEREAGHFFEWLVRERIWPQYILYSPDDVSRFGEMQRRGVFGEDHPFCMLVLGRYTDGCEGTTGELEDMLQCLDTEQIPWSVCCFGRQEHAAAIHAESRGGHVRLGFENNLLLQDGSPAPDNSALVLQLTAALVGATRQPATADEIRQYWLQS